MRATAVAAALAVVLSASPAHALPTGGKPTSSTGKACTVVGTVGNDHLFGTHGYDVICGFGGDDVIRGGGGKDVVDGGEGDDDVAGEDGADTVIGGPGRDKVNGGKGNDQVRGGNDADVTDGGGGGDLVDGGTGDDTVTGGAPADEPDPADAGDRVIGGDGNDTVDGGPGPDTVRGGIGDDTVTGGDGNDLVGGDSGADTVRGDEGSDRIDGGDGADNLDGGGGGDGVNGGIGNDTATGGIGDDTVRGGAGNDTATGGDGSDTMNGGPGDDGMQGGSGNDQVAGGSGADTVGGGDGDDDLDGGTGDDRVDGGSGNDVVEGGPGVNTCVNDAEDMSGDKCTDLRAPRLVHGSLTWITTPAVDNATDVALRLRGKVTDDRSGMMYVYVKFRGPDANSPVLTVGEHGATLLSGELHNGEFEMRGTLPTKSATGDWTLSEVYLQDRVFRYSRYTVQANGSFTLYNTVDGWNVETGTMTLPPLKVTGVSDTQAPVADPNSAVWTTPTELDNSTDRTARLRLPVTDDLSGAAKVTATLDGAGLDAPTVTLGTSTLVAGTVTAGTWEITGTVPAYLPAGTWRVSGLTLTDRIGRQRTVPPGDLTAIPALTVSGVSDRSRPTVDMTWGEYVGPTSGDNSVDRTVRLRIRAGDDVSGIKSIFADYRTTGAQSRLDPVTPAGEDGVWELVGRLPRGTTPGEWRVVGFYLYDKVGRERIYYVQADGSYTTKDGQLSGRSDFPRFTLLPVGG